MPKAEHAGVWVINYPRTLLRTPLPLSRPATQLQPAEEQKQSYHAGTPGPGRHASENNSIQGFLRGTALETTRRLSYRIKIQARLGLKQTNKGCLSLLFCTAFYQTTYRKCAPLIVLSCPSFGVIDLLISAVGEETSWP